MMMQAKNTDSSINGVLSATSALKYDWPEVPFFTGLRLLGFTTHVPKKLKNSDPKPIMQELIPEARPGLLGRI